MPNYQYWARDRSGRSVAGALAAPDEQSLREQLRRKELFVTRIAAQRQTSVQSGGLFSKRKVSLNDMVVMSRQLATLVRAGLPLVQCLDALVGQTQNQTLKEALTDIRNEVLAGATFSTALGRHSHIFSELYQALAQAGEMAGALDETLQTAAEQLDKEQQLREKVKSAFVYPIAVMVTAAGVVAFMLTVVVPVFTKVYGQFDAQLPGPTMLLVVLSNVITGYWYIVLAALFGLVKAFRWWGRTANGKSALDRVKLGMPLLGPLNRKIAISRLTRTLSAMLQAGVPILSGLQTSARVTGNTVFTDVVADTLQKVNQGARLSAPLEESGQFPSMVTHMIAAGEESGNMDEMLNQVCEFYDRDIDYAVERLTRMLEPLLTIVLGVIVGFILMALYMPIFSMSKVVQR
ncbi:MAG TPA: type II secretion system F family protein [Chthonomonadales bacterium]|nr:type II secretion system F family protein [Chthonomonadales bacterium]